MKFGAQSPIKVCVICEQPTNRSLVCGRCIIQEGFDAIAEDRAPRSSREMADKIQAKRHFEQLRAER